MTANRYKERRIGMPVEKHDTAAWANIHKTKPVSRVSIPDEAEVSDAKEHVDINEK